MKKLSMYGIVLMSMLGLVSYVAAQETAITTSMPVMADEPTICTMQYDPVCGEDGTTYGNSCMAQSVKIAYTGECKEEVVDEPAPIACTREYMPVCANVQVQCITAPCFPVQETFANACTAKAAGAEVIFEGDCNIAQGGVTDPTASDIVTRAYDLGITKYSNTAQFMYDAPVTREQAAKMIIAAIEASGVPEWMIKQQDGSCEWNDADLIDVSLINEVDASCAKGLFQGFNGNFMPRAYLTDTDARTVMYRVAQYVPALADHLALVRLAAINDVALTRGEFVSWLHNIYEQITPTLVMDPPALPVIPMIDGDYYLSMYNGTEISGTGITMSLSDGVVSAHICNMISGSYTIEHDSTADFMSFDKMMSTKMACIDDQITTIENQFNTIATAELDTSIDGQLTITLIGGNTMVWINK